MKTKLIALISLLTLFAGYFVSSASIGISPGDISFSGSTNRQICSNFSVIGDGTFKGEIKWSAKNSKNIIDYNLTSKNLQINDSFPIETIRGNYKICLSARKAGNYHGAILYKLENSSYGIGSWIELDIKDNNPVKKILPLELEGSAIKNTGHFKNTLWELLLIPFFGMIVFLIIKIRKAKKENLV